MEWHHCALSWKSNCCMDGWWMDVDTGMSTENDQKDRQQAKTVFKLFQMKNCDWNKRLTYFGLVLGREHCSHQCSPHSLLENVVKNVLMPLSTLIGQWQFWRVFWLSWTFWFVGWGSHLPNSDDAAISKFCWLATSFSIFVFLIFLMIFLFTHVSRFQGFSVVAHCTFPHETWSLWATKGWTSLMLMVSKWDFFLILKVPFSLTATTLKGLEYLESYFESDYLSMNTWSPAW